jgi:protein SCO1/2
MSMRFARFARFAKFTRFAALTQVARLGLLAAVAAFGAMPLAAIALPTDGETATPYSAAARAATPDFTLTDQAGRPFTLSRERGRVVVLFFGYTHCPDVCPTTLANLAIARAKLGEAGRNVTVAFVTVDPKRDTPAVVRDFVALFDRSFVGLTGTPEQLEPVYRAYHVTHAVAAEPSSAAGYNVSHTSLVYFIGRDGRLRGYGDWTDPPKTFELSLRELL